MKKILMLGRYDFSDHKGGVQFYANLLAKYLAKSNKVDLLVSSASAKTTVADVTNLRKIAVASFGNYLSVPISPGIIFWSWYLVFTKKYDIVHFNFPDPLSLLAFLILPKRSRWVVTWHSDIVRQKRMLNFYQPLVRFFMRRVDAVTVSTPQHIATCAQLIESFPKDKIKVIPFGVSESNWRPTEETQKKAESLRSRWPKTFIAYAFGRHIYYKGYEYLIRAIALTEGVHLVLGGSGVLTDELKSICRELGITERVTFVGNIEYQDLLPYFLATDVFCFTSVDNTETFGYAQVEAMLSGKAVICSDLGNGVNYVSRHEVTGITVPPRDPKAIAAALMTLKNQPELLRKYATQAKQWAHNEFTIEVSGKRTEEWYQSL